MSDMAMQNSTDLAMLQLNSPGIKLSGHKVSMEAIDKKSKEFEGVFMSQMLQPMFAGIKVNELFGGGHGEEVMRSFLIQEYGKSMAAGGHLGIASAVKDAMIKSQEKIANTANMNTVGAAYANAQ
jgi:Rod binding domain-containing protein